MTTHFSLRELTHSALAIEQGLDNTPGGEAREALRQLAEQLLEPLREAYGKPIAVTSGYRSPEVNARIAGAAPASQHIRGEAADCFTGDDPQLLVEVLLASGLAFDQAITYAGKPIVHLSYRKGRNRREVRLSG